LRLSKTGFLLAGDGSKVRTMSDHPTKGTNPPGLTPAAAAAKPPGFTTAILHADRDAPIEHGALHKPLHLSVAYGYRDVHDLAAVFQNRAQGYAYGRQGNPTTAALEAKVTQMEDGVATVCFTTGMAAIGAVLIALLKEGDHIVSSHYVFGNTNSMLETLAERGSKVSFVDATSVDAVRAAITPGTRVVFVETIANPRTQVADLDGIGALCRERGILYVVDNTMTSPWLFRPKSVGASLSINALTKYIGGHGNALGGAVTDTGLFDWTRFPNIAASYRNQKPAVQGVTQLRKKGLRDFGATLSAEAAHHLAIGSETLALRLDRQCANALALAEMLAAHPKVGAVHYPGLASHPQHARAAALFRHPGALLSFELSAGVDTFAVLNRLRYVALSSNLGDNRTLALPVAQTIFWEMGPARRAEMGIADSLVRVSVGIEDSADLIGDFAQALD
jgi:O-acetylhomoserine (thiol)-lyase